MKKALVGMSLVLLLLLGSAAPAQAFLHTGWQWCIVYDGQYFSDRWCLFDNDGTIFIASRTNYRYGVWIGRVDCKLSDNRQWLTYLGQDRYDHLYSVTPYKQ